MDEDDIEVYFGLMLLGGSLAVAVNELGKWLDIGTSSQVSSGLIVVSALLVSGAIVYSSIQGLRERTSDTQQSPHGD